MTDSFSISAHSCSAAGEGRGTEVLLIDLHSFSHVGIALCALRALILESYPPGLQRVTVGIDKV